MAFNYWKYTRGLVFVGDLLVINGLFIALYLTNHFIIATYDRSWLAFLAVINVSWLVIIFFTNPYRISRVYEIGHVIRDITYTVIQHFFVTCTVIYLLDFQLIHKWGPPLVYVAFLLFEVTWRLLFYYFLEQLRTRGYNYRRVVVAGYGQLSRNLQEFFSGHPEYGYRFMGVFDNESVQPEVLGKLDALKSYVKENQVREIYCCLPYLSYGTIKDIIGWGEDNFVGIKVIMDFRAFSYKGLELNRYDMIPVLSLSSLSLDSRRNQVIKRTFDILFSLTVIILIFSWLFPIIILLIKSTSKGGVFFNQKRGGKDNRIFNCYKFRTMYINDQADSLQATRNDPRVTPLGRWLRKTSLDELPQFFNVLEGNMSIVGPRPHPIRLNEKFTPLVSKYMVRHYAKPGITGLAQARGFRGETQTISDMRNRIKLDRFYIENWSFALDVKIILLTVFELLRGSKKAY
ncbi:MAG: undecaprenyl-phosphate glucose phosphotransferase [Cyclobacteriaceae bacterium]